MTIKAVTPNAKDLISEAKAAKILDRKVASLKKWRVQGRGPAYFKIRGRVRYKREDLVRFMETEIEHVVPAQRKSA